MRRDGERPPSVERDEAVRERLPERSGLGRVDARSHEDRSWIELPGRDRTYRLRPPETVLLRHIGAFRSVRREDLQRLGYSNDEIACRADIRSLKERGLVAERTRIELRSGHLDRIVTLTIEGASVARSCVADSRQAVYTGIGNTRDLSHDADVYRMFHAEAARIEHAGGRVRRILLELELMRYLGRSAATSPEDGPWREQLAEEHGLAVISGTVQIPDLRIEYDGPSGDVARVDLELATRHYTGPQLARKAQAGFRIYAPAPDVVRLHSILERRGVMSEILSL